MPIAGPIIVVEDDLDDQNLMEEAIRESMENARIIFFADAKEALAYLASTKDNPFVIFCDINLPKLNGIEFKRKIDSEPYLRKKSIPFVFFSTAVSQAQVNEAYLTMTVQGFFQKSSSYQEYKNIVKLILNYWELCRHPNVV